MDEPQLEWVEGLMELISVAPEAERAKIVEQWLRERPLRDPTWSAFKQIQEPAEGDYYWALKEGLATTPEKERTLRILAWWQSNDAYRTDPEPRVERDVCADGEWRSNIQALVNLLGDTSVDDCLLKAEALRELGEFESARRVLDGHYFGEATEAVRYLRILCDRKDTYVRELQPST